MQFRNRDQNSLKEQLQKYGLPEHIIDKIVLHNDDNWIEQLIIKLQNSTTHEEALSKILELFMLRNFSNTPAYISKDTVLKKFPISKRKFEELVRQRLISFIEVSQKNRVYNVDDLYKHIEEYKVNSIVYKVDPILLQQTISSLHS